MEIGARSPETQKTASSTTLEDNEASMRTPVQLRPPSSDYRAQDHHLNPAHHGETAWNEFVGGTPKLLGRAFDEFQPSSRKDKAFIAEHFSSKDYESHSPLLRKYEQAGLVSSGASLHERTRSLLPR